MCINIPFLVSSLSADFLSEKNSFKPSLDPKKEKIITLKLCIYINI